MRAAILEEPGVITIRDIPTPEPGPGELLIKVEAALTCGTDLKAFRRGHPMIAMPGPFGHEFSGTVAARGRGVRRWREGDAVMAVHSAPCRTCFYCRKGLHNLCENVMGTKVMGAFAQYVLLPQHIVAQNVYAKPAGLGFAEAALLEPLACVVHGVAPLSIRPGDTALVIGCGPIGLLHVMLLVARGARVLVSDPHAQRLKMARQAGAEATSSPKSISRNVKRFTGGYGVDFVFECTGRPEVWEASVEYVRRGGTVTLFGGCPSGTRVSFDTHRLHYDEITLRGDFHFSPADVREAHRLLCEGRVDGARMLSGEFALREVHKALALLSKGQGLKYIITP